MNNSPEMKAVSRIRPASKLWLGRTSPEAPAPLLKLKATSDGWSLLGEGDEVVFHAPDRAGRQRCLEFAREHGVLALSR